MIGRNFEGPRSIRGPVPPPATPRADVRTDLAVEAVGPKPIPGVKIDRIEEDGILVSRVQVETYQAAQEIGKTPGRYITVDAPRLRERERKTQERVAAIIGRELRYLLGVPKDAEIFVVGLGNWRATPDALGPRVIENLMVTRHLWDHVPPDLRGGLRPVSALAPGVLGITGIETWDIISSIVDRIRPAAVVAVDALAAMDLNRIVTSVQLADTGIHPGSGVGNRRTGITRETLGVPVIALGVPTVVHAVTIASQTIDMLVSRLRAENRFYQLLDAMEGNDKYDLIHEILSPAVGDLMVTPKEIDILIEDMAYVVAAGINQALHPDVDSVDFASAFPIQ